MDEKPPQPPEGSSPESESLLLSPLITLEAAAQAPRVVPSVVAAEERADTSPASAGAVQALTLVTAADVTAVPSIIRTETALSRFPVHCLTKGEVRIELKNQAGALFWQVSHSNIHGQPGALAYKVDTRVVNRAIDEADRPLPRFLRLGSLADICRQLGMADGGKQKADVRHALQQNAFAGITARITYRVAERAEKTLEASFNRYAVVFTGEMLPDGKRADAVYLILSDIYLEVLNAALTRPLDYDYMTEPPPMAQRFYEIVSYRIYAALLYRNETARLRYSEFCLLSTATRYPEFDQVKKQMYKIHKPHIDSGYLDKVSYEATRDDDGQPDWFMVYRPGLRAAQEFHRNASTVQKAAAGEAAQAFTNASTALPPQSAAGNLVLPFDEPSPRQVPKPAKLAKQSAQQALSSASAAQSRTRDPAAPPPLGDNAAAADPAVGADPPEPLALIEELVQADLNRTDAERFARERPEEARRQLDYLPYVTQFKSSRGAYLRRAIEQGFSPPRGYAQAKEQEHKEQERRLAAERQKARETAQEARRAAEAAELDESIVRLKQEAPETFTAFQRFVQRQREETARKYGEASSLRKRMLADFDHPEKRRSLFRAWETLGPDAQADFYEPPVPKARPVVPLPPPSSPAAEATGAAAAEGTAPGDKASENGEDDIAAVIRRSLQLDPGDPSE